MTESAKGTVNRERQLRMIISRCQWSDNNQSQDSESDPHGAEPEQEREPSMRRLRSVLGRWKRHGEFGLLSGL